MLLQAQPASCRWAPRFGFIDPRPASSFKRGGPLPRHLRGNESSFFMVPRSLEKELDVPATGQEVCGPISEPDPENAHRLGASISPGTSLRFDLNPVHNT